VHPAVGGAEFFDEGGDVAILDFGFFIADHEAAAPVGHGVDVGHDGGPDLDAPAGDHFEEEGGVFGELFEFGAELLGCGG